MSQSDIINSRQIQWFPGHMTKTLRLIGKGNPQRRLSF